MNIAAYEVINDKIDKTKTWFYANKKCIYSRELKGYKYYCIAKRYNNIISDYDLFIILSNDDIGTEKGFKEIKTDDYGRVVIYPGNSILSMLGLDDVTKDINIQLSVEECDETNKVFKFN